MTLLTLGTVAAVDSDTFITTITTPDSGEEIWETEDLQIEWAALNNDTETRTLEDSEVILEDSEENTYSNVIDLDETRDPDEDVLVAYTVDSDILEDQLEAGDISIKIEDNWDLATNEGSLTVELLDFEEEDDEDEPEPDVGINSPDDESEHDKDEDLDITWIVENTGDDTGTVNDVITEVEDEFGRNEQIALELNKDIEPDEEEQQTVTFGAEEDLDNYGGDWTIDVEADWDITTVSEQITIHAVEGSGDDEDDEDDELIAEASSNDTDILTGKSLEFDASESTGDIESFEWDFDDGNTDTGETVSHSFDEAGTYDVELEVADDAGIDTETVTVNVDPEDSDELGAVIQTDSTTVEPQESLEFDGSSSTGEPESFDWDFDDGNTDTGETVIHSFENTGTYTVELEVENDGTDLDTLEVDVEGDQDDEESEDEETDTETNGEEADENERGDPQAGDEETEEETEEETDEAGDEETDEEETGSECPEGFSYDEENDVCIEDDDEDTTAGALDTVTDTEVAGIPVWLIVLLAAFAGLQVYWWKK